ncbi:pentatricopeptide repeat-containing protein At5g06540 [Arachis ipaensis]|uniref:pentatricopeptide repeat-containing protein At5g06540 n=1 Tax=Arachis ipaensis TaxID=130454 RepID=UPI0007AFD67B|nr:pentatricopeptide repeat-containing protein At5g06540 [Arachis ipaensis]
MTIRRKYVKKKERENEEEEEGEEEDASCNPILYVDDLNIQNLSLEVDDYGNMITDLIIEESMADPNNIKMIPASKNAIESLEKVKLENNNHLAERCSICLTEFDYGDDAEQVSSMPCKHNLPACTQVHTHVLKFGLSFDSHAANGLVRGYSVSGDFARARLMFDEMPDRSLSLWTTMVCGYVQNQCYDEALGLFDEMIGDGLEPNAATLASVLSACARAGYLELGQRIHEFMKVKGFEVKVILGTALVYMYAKNGEIVMARKLFDEMTERNVVTWNVMISGLAAHGHVEDALGLFEKLKEEQAVVPNDVTFLGVLSACCHAGLVDVGREIFYSMKNVYGVDAKIEHYGCMVDLLGKEGKLIEAEELVKGMPWKPDIVILGALLAACKNNGNTKVAKRVVKEILALEPHNHGVHVAMSNIYAEAGQWNEVLRLRKVMKEERLKKTPGWSLVAT